ncbi:MAG: orotidine-5'-phosphate decarboxylase [Bacteroidales bacterium]|nr:orotidine-5'-phosphate decarboxylase [Bacteroidales bacterium]MCH3942039.1 orotidine-5'-phosphate decarboxylase [Bacteroidales bacterium]MCI2135627.1 orotidine-5'-phosphate decarboxylase [Bacteroidales bacterium]
MTTDDIFRQIRSKRAMLCVGLDTDYAKLPECVKSGRSVPEAVLEFNRRIVDATAPHCVAFKPNLAFYEYLGAAGWDVLGKTVEYIRSSHPEEFIIADAKRGDIGNTAKMYARTLFETFDFDAVTLSPYMGSETVTPFLEYPGRYAIVVALSSNPSSSDFQGLINDTAYGVEGKPLYRAVMEKMMSISTPDNMMFVVGATKAGKLKEIRAFCPDNFFLVPGVGAQGGSAEEVIANGASAKGGLLINSSRAILYASSGEDYAQAAAAVASRTAIFKG